MIPTPLQSSGCLKRIAVVLATAAVIALPLSACKRSEPPPDLVKTQRDAMEKAKDVGKTMQKSVDDQGKKADEASR